jgi:glycerol-3-phosphate dehydrogenase
VGASKYSSEYMKTRLDALRSIAAGQFDVCVIGAGATGSGCALDSQLRGFQTVLVDAGDFASATSSASTKLAHGGVRYLQQAVAEFDFGQLRVVREALRERILLLQNAHHLAHALEFVVPCFTRFDILYYGVGMKLYDWFAGRASLGKSRILTKPETLRLVPSLNAYGLVGGVSYYDGQFDDARFGVTLVNTFTEVRGEVANYLRVVDFEREHTGRLVAAVVEEVFTRQKSIVRARAFVNATGPFSDGIRLLANPSAMRRLVRSKGAHILLPLENQDSVALLIPKTEDGRVIFAIPWLGRLLVGTTDQEVNSPEQSVVTREDAEYLLRHLNHYSTRKYKLEDVVSGFAGVRPLVQQANSRQTKRLIREHEVDVDDRSGLVSILGGKWTTYRVMAKHTIDAIAGQLEGAPRPSVSQHHLMAGASGHTPEYWKTLVRDYGVSESTARHLAEKFGTQSAMVLELTKQNPELKSPIVVGSPTIQAEIVFCIRQEMAVTIEDILARRIGLQFFDWRLAMEAAPVVASHLAQEMAWSHQERGEAVQAYVAKIKRSLSSIGLHDR